jgi:hypothetical protein
MQSAAIVRISRISPRAAEVMARVVEVAGGSKRRTYPTTFANVLVKNVLGTEYSKSEGVQIISHRSS